MKKLLALVLTAVLMTALTVPAFAAGKKAVKSANNDLEVEDVEYGVESVDGCVTDLEVTPLENKDHLKDVNNEKNHDAVQEMDSAWKDVKAHESDIKDLCPDLPDEDLEVSRMFYVSFYCDHDHDLKGYHHYANLSLSASECSELVALLRYDAVTGTWEMVPFDLLSPTSIRFMLSEPSPYAMIVKDKNGRGHGDGKDDHGRKSPQTGEASALPALGGALVFACGAVVLTGKSRKHS